MLYNKGFSLIEVVIYVALLAVLSVSVANFLIQMANTYHRSRAEREVLSNARLLLERVNKVISQAGIVYSPTSRFDSDTGQLSLAVPITTDPGHNFRYVDFWVDNGLFYIREEGASAAALSAASVRVASFRLQRISQGVGREAVRVILKVDYGRPKFATSATLSSTTALRGNY